MIVKRHHVYIMGRAEGEMLIGPVKIGFTRSLASRLKTVQTGMPYKLELIAAVMMPTRDLARGLERGLHELLRAHAMHGEWFDIDPVEAVGVLAQATKLAFEHCGIAGAELYDALDKVGATDCQRFYVQRLQERH
jgi:hypothetical protein